MLLNVGFLWLWRVLPRRIAIRATFPRVTLLLTLTLSAWGGFATVFVLGMDRLNSVGISTPILGGAAALLMLVAGILACSRRPRAQRQRAVRGAVLTRGLLAGAAIGVAVWMVNVAGLCSRRRLVFPAIFLTTMVSVPCTRRPRSGRRGRPHDARLVLRLSLCTPRRVAHPYHRVNNRCRCRLDARGIYDATSLAVAQPPDR